MIITLVMDQYGKVNNGTTASAMRYAQLMREHGHTVRIVTCIPNVKEENVYVVPKREVPFIGELIASHGMELALPDEKVLIDAIADADIVHFYLPFILEKAGKEIADRYHVASTAAFHLQPENITSSIYLNNFEPVNTYIYRLYRKFYDKFTDIHVPSAMVKEYLAKHKYKARVHVISNGVCEGFEKRDVERPDSLKDKYVIMMSGRHSREKRQDLLIKAAAMSKYSDRIRLILCGKGPWGGVLKKLAQKYKPDTVFPFYETQEDMVNAINCCDLYVHASDAETEAISCIETFTCGLVPVISDSKKCATKQFALDDRCLFKHGNVKDLIKKIEYFIEHPQEKEQLSKKYLEYSKEFKIDQCVLKLEKVFERVVEENRLKWGDLVGKLESSAEADRQQKAE